VGKVPFDANQLQPVPLQRQPDPLELVVLDRQPGFDGL
jgi:hypothetical protein